MKETQFIKVKPDAVNSTIEMWTNFGWELLGAPQEIYNEATHRTQETDKHYSSEYTTTTNYVKITFQRDTERKNYAELVKLEKQYYAPLPSLKTASPGDRPKKPGVISLIIMIILLLFGILFFLTGTSIFMGIVFLIPGIILLFRRITFSSKLKNWETANEAYQTNHPAEEEAISEAKKKRNDALEKARSLV